MRALREKLERGEKLRVFFLNDLGFQFGAGIAHLRQVQSFLLMGHEVLGVCFKRGEVEGDIDLQPTAAKGIWHGMRQLTQPHVDQGYDEEAVAHAIVAEITPLCPDIIIVGNLHAAKWPLQIFKTLPATGALVIGFMHDCYLITGRCAYPESCPLYETGCDESCPTADEYPALAPSKIPAAWQLRRDLFCGPRGIPLAANSRWTLSMAQRSMKGLYFADVVYYGLDERLFKPIGRRLARRLLGIPQDEFVILAGAINVNERRKGGHILREVVKALSNDAYFMVMGFEPSDMNGIHATGMQRDYRKMPLIYSAADLFVGTSLDEAFGQTLCEAAACSLPIVAFEVGGVPEVARQGLNARLVRPGDVSGLLEGIRDFMRDPDRCTAFGKAGRALVEDEFTLRAQGERWMSYLNAVTSGLSD